MSLQPDQTAADAFERLRHEVALLRRAVEGVAADREGEAVDYSPTLAAISEAIGDASAKIGALGERPALALAPEQIGAVLQAAATRVLGKPIAELERDRMAFARATETLQAVRQAETARSRAWRRTAALVGGGALAGAILWGVLPGPIARLLPTTWNVPERLAAASLGLPMPLAGERLLRQGDPVTWDAVQIVLNLPDDQRDAFRQCVSAPATKRTNTCTLKLRTH